MSPAIDLEKIDWNSINDTRSLFESVLAMLKSKDEENVTLRKDIEQLREETEAIAGDRMMLTEMGARIEQLEGENEQKDAKIGQQAAEIEQRCDSQLADSSLLGGRMAPTGSNITTTVLDYARIR